ncbi:AcrR family transcriptional regulator [Kibdelosporangium banguiense]|uniref:AcrR family transcriptional regulator n=1 Tax=Kibdelosporangium banguiense TaxID=1365924 RepID=A0ABS4TPD4_9PSEU|nr:TetR/AcrR family transcriptional regulator [Kibdelosporangium banguiense]MBP2326263.1 AcrR family transcriptional regulator [Kibdelosporangium banguiense]
MPRETLTKDQIVQAAIELLDAEGLDGLSMRQLGNRLNSAATAVYWHVKNKDNLVVLAADAVWSEVSLAELNDWRTAATTMAHDLYAMILRHPWLVPAMSTHILYGPGKARHDDHLLAVFETAGFTGRAVTEAVNVVFTFVLGTALGASAEIASRRRTPTLDDTLIAEITQIAAQFPRLNAHSQGWDSQDPRDALDSGLTTILDGLQTRLDQ